MKIEQENKYKIIEKSLKESEYRWRLLSENFPVTILSIDRNGKILFVNRSTTGLKIEEALGKTIYDFLDPAYRTMQKNILRNVLKTGKVRAYEIAGYGPGGSMAWYSSRLVPIKKHGKIVALNLISINITDFKKTSDALKESEKKIFSIIDAAGDGILVLDASGRHILANKKIAEMTGYSVGEILEKTFMQLGAVDKSVLPKILKMFVQTVASGKHVWKKNIELTIIRKDRSKFPAEISSSIVKKDGKISGFILVIRDISERKKIEDTIGQSEEKFRTIFNSANDYLILIDKTGKIVDINDAAVKNYGGKREELIGKHFSRVGLMASIKDIVNVTKNFDLFLKGKKYFLNIKVKNKLGQEAFLECSATAFRLKKELQGILVVARDVTERKIAEENLQIEKNKLQKYLDVSEVVIMILDQNKKVLSINKKGVDLLGYGAEEIIGKNWCDNFVPEIHKEEVKRNFEKVLSGRGANIDHFESQILAKDRKERTLVWRRTLLEDKKSKIKNILSAGVDITELREAMVTIEQLKEFDRLKDEFLNITAHELRSPLTSIVGLSELINQNKEYLSSDHQKYINIIYQEGIKLTHIIKRILTITRYESGREIFNFEKFNLSEFILRLKPSLDILAKAKNSNIIIDIEDKNIFLESDKEKISQVVYNFVENAVKYGPDGQVIRILATKPDKEMIKISVIDQGMGVPKDLQSKLFTKFSQLESAFSRSQEGTGLGLYICKIIIERLGGKIGVKSVAGEGAIFYFILPLKQKD